jgi:hypothetical protein
MIKKIVFLIETAVRGTKTLFSEAGTILFGCEKNFSITEKIVDEAPTAFATTY